eukprot:6447970-Prymnesium_polylepis.2
MRVRVRVATSTWRMMSSEMMTASSRDVANVKKRMAKWYGLGQSMVTVIHKLPSSPRRIHTAPSATGFGGSVVPIAQSTTVKRWCACTPQLKTGAPSTPATHAETGV